MTDKPVTCHLIFQTPLGDAAIVYHKNPFVIKRIYLPAPHPKAIPDITEDSHEDSHESAIAISEQLREYFNGVPVQVPWYQLDMSCLTPLQQSVLRATADIPYGNIWSYKKVAVAIGSPGAARFVGNTMAKNPFPLLIPCHRVVRSDGTIGKFGGGTEMKKKLIRLEAENMRLLESDD